MERQPVASSNVASIGYDPNGSELQVEFKNGSVYSYWNVPVAEYRALMGARSKGSYLHFFIKGSYPVTQES